MKIVKYNTLDDSQKRILATARDVAHHSFNRPGKNYRTLIGAAGLSTSGRVYRGAFFENVTGPGGACAEMIVIGSAIACGDEKLTALGIYCERIGGGKMSMRLPCGLCRQALVDHANRTDVDIEILCLEASSSDVVVALSSELLPGV